MEVASGQLHYAMAREYSGRIGRFSMADPAGGAGSAARGNLYTYGANDPINLADPSGLNPNGPNQYALLAGAGGLGFVLGGGANCTLDGVSTDCGYISTLANLGLIVQVPGNNSIGVNSRGQLAVFQAFADGSSGDVPLDAPPGYSVQDFVNAMSVVGQAAQGKPLDPSTLTARAKEVYDLLKKLGVSPNNIVIYQNGSQGFTAVLTDAGFQQLESSSLVSSGLGDAFLHYPYTDGGRSDQTPSLHYVWENENLTDYVGGSGVYMQFHADAYNPRNGGFWQHWGCDVFHVSCPH